MVSVNSFGTGVVQSPLEGDLVDVGTSLAYLVVFMEISSFVASCYLD